MFNHLIIACCALLTDQYGIVVTYSKPGIKIVNYLCFEKWGKHSANLFVRSGNLETKIRCLFGSRLTNESMKAKQNQ